MPVIFFYRFAISLQINFISVKFPNTDLLSWSILKLSNLNFPAIKYCGICLTFSVCCFVHGGCCLKFVQTVFGYLVFCICCFVVCCFEFNVLCFGVGCFLVLHIVLILNKSTYSYGCPKNSLLS